MCQILVLMTWWQASRRAPVLPLPGTGPPTPTRVYHAWYTRQSTVSLWVRFIFLHSSTIVRMADLTHPSLTVHEKRIFAKRNASSTIEILASISSLML